VGKDRKKPKAQFNPVTKKEPRAGADPSSSQRELPTWRFRIVDTGGPWCWSAMGTLTARRVLKRLQDFESMKWGEILGADHHAIPAERLIQKARDRLAEIKQDDADEVISLHVTGKERVYGIRDGSALKLLWWDPEHEICPSEKKHT
jgi:hypothetical protein